jgi:hypothetical protein
LKNANKQVTKSSIYTFPNSKMFWTCYSRDAISGGWPCTANNVSSQTETQ